MAAKSVASSINDLYKVIATVRGQGISKEILDRAKRARETDDSKLMGQVLADIYVEVARIGSGLEVPNLDNDSFGKKVGFLLTDQNLDDVERLRESLGQYRRDLAVAPMKDAIKIGASIGLVKEVVREPTGDSTCPWCLERCGTWDPYDANAYGVWARHYPTCDCNIYIRYVQNDQGMSLTRNDPVDLGE